MVDVGVGKVPLGATKPPSRSDGGIWPTSTSFNRARGQTMVFPALKCSVGSRSAGETELGSPKERLD